jgi:hypothetical protein
MTTTGKIELNIKGLTFEAPTDDRTHPRALKVGDRVKLLQKKYDDTYDSRPGIIVAIDAYVSLPTIVVMYAEYSYGKAPELKFANFNEKTKGDAMELLRMTDEEAAICVKEDAMEQFNRAESDLRKQLEILLERREFFLRRFGVAFGVVARDLKAPAVPQELAGATA